MLDDDGGMSQTEGYLGVIERQGGLQRDEGADPSPPSWIGCRVMKEIYDQPPKDLPPEETKTPPEDQTDFMPRVREDLALSVRQAKLDVLDEVLKILKGTANSERVRNIRNRVVDEELVRDTVSSNINGFGFDLKNGVLTVRFPAGTYIYLGVSEDLYEEFRSSKSRGGFLARRIKGAYPFEKVRP